MAIIETIGNYEIINKKSRTEISHKTNKSYLQIVIDRQLTEKEIIKVKDILKSNQNNWDVCVYLISNSITDSKLKK